jgi:hypothetical protein
MKGIRWILAGMLLLSAGSAQAAVANLTVDVPKTAYIEWLTASADNMTSVNGDNTFAFDPYVGGAITQLTNPAVKPIYIGVMCNSLAGYDLTFSAGAGATGTTGLMVQPGAANITYTAALSRVGGTFTGGTTASETLDLTGGSASGSTVHVAEADLPMAIGSPNVWQLDLSLPVISTVADGLIQSGTYTGGITATISLK